jgi:hypothetical protein
MIFELSTSGYFYSDKDEMDNLKKLGFTFREVDRDTSYNNDRVYTIDDDKPQTIEINTIDELMKFVKQYGRIVVDHGTIEIYDGYRE